MKRFLWIGLFLHLLFFAACRDRSPEIGETYLVRVGKETFTIEDFKRSFELAKIAYEDDTLTDQKILIEIQTRHLKDIIEELILLERANELHLEISEQELENVVWKIQKDYPDRSFEQIFLEKAISYSFWKESLRKKLLKDRVIFEELEKNILVLTEEINEFYENHFDAAFIHPENEKKAMAISQEIIRQIRREKAKKQYPIWIKELWARYGVELNETAWIKMISHEL